MNAWALIVTYNRKHLLIECLEALLAQTHPLSAIVVYDNGSTDGTGESLAAAGLMPSPLLRYVRSEANDGGASGYAQVLRIGSAGDADWLWLMDDDAEPRADALERLLASPVARDQRAAALCSAVVNANGSVDPLHRCRLHRLVTPLPLSAYTPGSYSAVDCASFVGMLVRREAVRASGLPREEFFLGYDDAEYSLRLRQQGAIRLVPESVVVHKLAIGGGSETRRSRWWNRVLGARYAPSLWDSYWKDLYRIRNLVAMKRDHQGLSRAGLGLVIAAYVVKTLLYDERPLRRIPWLIRFALKGFRGDFAAPAPEQWAAFARSAGSIA